MDLPRYSISTLPAVPPIYSGWRGGLLPDLVGRIRISSAIRFLLREELLSHFHLSRGLPELIASTLHYLLLLLVFFFAVNLGGVELNRFTVLTGALGVGVGFGLQNIVNNFISGLILQFERPIHIGDVLDIDGTTGKVRVSASAPAPSKPSRAPKSSFPTQTSSPAK